MLLTTFNLNAKEGVKNQVPLPHLLLHHHQVQNKKNVEEKVKNHIQNIKVMDISMGTNMGINIIKKTVTQILKENKIEFKRYLQE